MNKKDVIEFFDRLAPCWDSMQTRNEEVIAEILSKGGVREGVKVLDVACGTGVLFPDYLGNGVATVTGIDISDKMLEIAKEKFPQINLICDDAETYCFKDKYDVIMIYNAFPHFSKPEKLLENLSKALNTGGRLTVAHGMSEKELEKCHSGRAEKVSLPLVKKEALAEMMSLWFEVDVMISDDRMYMVSCRKK